MHELHAITGPGRDLVALAEFHAEEFARDAAAHDRDASYPHDAIASMLRTGYLAAPIPEAIGGLGVASVHDLLVASARLARGNASVAIGVNMHLAAVINLVRRLSIAEAASDERRRAAFSSSLEEIARDGVVMAAAISEPNQDLTRPATTAARTENGWRIDGRKIFCTMSPAATLLYTAVSFHDREGVTRYGYALIPTDTPGVVVNDDWDAMGMRASGSHSITLDAVEVPAEALRGGFRAGESAPYLERNLPAGLFHASASLGIAESAYATAVGAIAQRGRGLDEARTRVLVAESAIDLTAARATLARSGGLIDDYYAGHPLGEGDESELTELFADAQATKTFVNEASSRIVDRALGLSGGAGYLNGHPLGRAYRDVRAGAFMHPLGANRAYEYVGQVALGLEASVH